MQRLLSSRTSCLGVKRVVLGSAVGLPGLHCRDFTGGLSL